ncbi:MAG: M24 family metallopeptidase [Lachnospiraceae bacterium]|nr:M24 family metallopeptidase [Lachnospiraceae bacterium]
MGKFMETAKRIAEHRQAVMEKYFERIYGRMGRKENVEMLEVKFYDTVDDALLKFAVIVSQSNGKWVFCKHKERNTWEVPGGHRESGEDIFETAKRELMEETGAVKFDIRPICVYSVTEKTRVNDDGEESYGLLCAAEITEFSDKLYSEMEKVIITDELPKAWTYPLIQPRLLEKYMEWERESYRRIQFVAKRTIEYIENMIRPGINLLEIRTLCEDKMLELGADSFWYWNVGAFVFAGDETTISVSGKQYVTSDRVIEDNDIITIDLSPQAGNIWGDYARTIVIEKGTVVENIELIENLEWQSGLQMEEKLHTELLRFATKETTFEELYYHMNKYIVENGFVNLDFMGNLGHSIVKAKGDRIYIEKGNKKKLGDVNYFTFEPHITFPDSKYGYKKENIYYFEEGRLLEL